MEVKSLSPDQHVFTLFGRHFLLDVPTGALLSLDDEACRALADPAAADPAVAAEIAALQARGLLRPDPVRGGPVEPAPGWLKALCLHVSHDCNLRCAYCFAGQGSFGGERGTMRPEIGRRAVDLLLERSGPVTALEVDFFGGEPLLAMETVRAVVDYGRRRAEEAGKTIHFTLTTNA
ncbi:MAG: 4Fe-4S cluster-binding domain-containing protein, partial [Bacteroidota bacterium]